MFRFLHPFQDGRLSDVMIGAKNLHDAFQQYARDWWTIEMTGAVAVFQNAALIARVVPVTDVKTGELQPHIQLIRVW